MIIEMYDDMFWISQIIQVLKRLKYTAVIALNGADHLQALKPFDMLRILSTIPANFPVRCIRHVISGVSYTSPRHPQSPVADAGKPPAEYRSPQTLAFSTGG